MHMPPAGALAATTLVALGAAALAQTDPTLPQDADDEQVMVPEDADDGAPVAGTLPEDADDGTPAPETPLPSVTTTPSAEPLRQATAPSRAAPAGDCWVRLHDDPSFAGHTVTLRGPAELAELTVPFSAQGDGATIGSLEVGAGATVSAFADVGFIGTETRYASGLRVASVDGALKSLRIACEGAAAG